MRNVKISRNPEKALWQMYAVIARLSEFQTTLGVTPAEIGALQLNATNLQYLVNFAKQLKDRVMEFSAFRKSMLDGAVGVVPPLPVFESVALPEATVGGILTAFRQLVKKIKASPGYTVQIGEALGLVIATPEPQPEPAFKPTCKAIALPANEMEVRFTKGKYDGARVYVRQIGQTDWQDMGLFTHSPAKMAAPVAADQPAMLEFRIKLMKANLPASDFSPIYRVVSNPD